MAKIYGVTTATTESNDKRIGIIKENSDGNFSYSTDGLTFKTVSGESSGTKGYDFVIAPQGATTESVDVVLTGTDDQDAINKFLTDTVSKITGYVPTIKFLGGTVKLTGTVTIPCNVNFISDENTTFEYMSSTSSDSMIVNSNKYLNIVGVTFKDSNTNWNLNKMISNYSGGFYNCTFMNSNNTLDLVAFISQSSIDEQSLSQSLIVDNCTFINLNDESIQAINANAVLEESSYITHSIFKISDPNGYLDVSFNATITNCEFIGSGAISVDGGSNLDEPDNLQLPKIVKNCNFAKGIDIDLGGRRIENCIINGHGHIASFISNIGEVPSGIIENCQFGVTGTVDFNSSRILNCQFGLIDATNLPQVSIKNCDLLQNCNFADAIFVDVLGTNTSIVDNCIFTQSGSMSISSETVKNCIFKNSKSKSSEPLLTVTFVDNCTFTGIDCYADSLITVNTSASIKSSIRDCTINIGSLESQSSFKAINGFNSVTNCTFTDLSDCSPAKGNASYIVGASVVSDIRISDNATTSGNVTCTFYELSDINVAVVDLQPLQNIFFRNINLNSNTKEFFTDDPATTDYYITLNNIVMASKEPHFKIPTSRKFIVDGLTINTISTESYTSLFEAPNNLSIPTNCSISNVTLGPVTTSNNYYLLSTGSIVTETQLRFSNIHILNASSTFNLLQIRDTATVGSNAILCDNISVAGPSSPVRDLEDLFPTVVHPIYSNYSYIDLAQQLQITNYSSNAAVKFDDGKAYIYNSSTGNWIQMQLVAETV